MCERARDDGADDHAIDLVARKSFELEQLVKPDAILVGGPARVGGDPPAFLDLALVHQREDEVRIPGVDGKQHGGALAVSAAVHNSTSPARTISRRPSPRLIRSAPSASIPSNLPETVSSGPEGTDSDVPVGGAAANT